MKIIFALLLLGFSAFNLIAQDLPRTKANEKSFPTNISNENFNEINDFDGKIVAFDAVIERNEVSRNKTPFYKLKISDNYLWTVLMFGNEVNKVGDTIRVVGYLRPVPAKPNKIEKAFLDGKYMVIAFGLVDFVTSNFLFLGGAGQQKQEWIDGKIPSSE